MSVERSLKVKTAAHVRRQRQREELDEHVRRIVDQAPPLTDDQCARIAALLRPYRQVAP
jgi:hypothetical protein